MYKQSIRKKLISLNVVSHETDRLKSLKSVKWLYMNAKINCILCIYVFVIDNKYKNT